MDNFDKQIALLKPTTPPAQLDARQLMKNLIEARRVVRMRRLFITLMGLASITVLIGALRRDILEIVRLTFDYFGELPSLFAEFSGAYVAAISWPSVMSLALLAGVSTILLRARKDLTAATSRRAYRYAAIFSVLALTLSIAGIFMSPSHASAQQEQLKRRLNEKGHLEVQVAGAEYELYGKSKASDESIRNQAFIERLRNMNISTVYPDLITNSVPGQVVEVRAVNSKDDCIFHVERSLEPVSGKITDTSSSCIRSEDSMRYLTSNLKPTKAPKWKKGQALYLTSGTKVDSANPMEGYVGIAVVLDGKADQYVAAENSQKIVPKGQPSTGSTPCGINNVDQCPEIGSIDVFSNAEGHMAGGENGSSVSGDSLKIQKGSTMKRFFGKLTAASDDHLEIKTSSGKKIRITWDRNIIKQFNQNGARNYRLANGPLRIEVGDSLELHISYRAGIDMTKLQLSDVWSIRLAIKTTAPDPLENETYSKDKSSNIEKY